LHSAARVENQPQICVVIRQRRPDANRLLEQLRCCLVVAALMDQDSKQVERRRVLRLSRQDLPINDFRGVQPTGCVMRYRVMQLSLEHDLNSCTSLAGIDYLNVNQSAPEHE